MTKTESKTESRADTFIRLAKPRVEKVLKALRILGNCSNRSSYEYTDEQVSKMFQTITEVLKTTMGKFEASKEKQESFDF